MTVKERGGHRKTEEDRRDRGRWRRTYDDRGQQRRT